MTDILDFTQKPTVLVVDDTPDNLSLMSGLLKGLYRVKLHVFHALSELYSVPVNKAAHRHMSVECGTIRHSVSGILVICLFESLSPESPPVHQENSPHKLKKKNETH